MNKYVVFILAAVLTVALILAAKAGVASFETISLVVIDTASICYIINQLK